MNGRRAAFAMAVSLTVATVANAGGPCDRLRPFPVSPGWAHLGVFKTDTPIGGAYHDSESGAYVSYSTQTSADVPVRPDDEMHELNAAGVGLRIWKGPDARGRWATQYLEALRAFGRDTLGPEYEERLPPEGSKSIIAVFAFPSTGRYLVAAAGVRGDEQDARVDAFLRRGVIVGDSKDCSFDGLNRVRPRRVEGLRMGAKVGEVLESLGPPNDVVRWSDDGFAIAYGLEGGRQRYSSVRLCFDRHQRLEQKIFR